LPNSPRASRRSAHARLTERPYTTTKTGKPTTMDTSAIGKQSESLRDQSLRYCMRAPEEAGRCSVTLGRAGELSMRKRAATATFANFNFAKPYLELKRLRGDVERIKKIIEVASKPSGSGGPRYTQS
jgi:hypothetical protein